VFFCKEHLGTDVVLFCQCPNLLYIKNCGRKAKKSFPSKNSKKRKKY